VDENPGCAGIRPLTQSVSHRLAGRVRLACDESHRIRGAQSLTARYVNKFITDH